MNKTIKSTAAGVLLCSLIMAAMVVTTLLLTSCGDDDMDIKKLNAESKIVLFCFPTPENDTTCITLMRSVPITEHEPESMYGETTEELKIANAKVNFRLNGVEQEVRYAAEQTGSVPAGNYYVVSRIAAGDKIEVRAAADELPQVSSTTTVPICEPIKSIDATTVVHDLIYYKQLLVKLNGASMRGSYYAVTVSMAYTLQGRYENGNDTTISYRTRMEVELSDEPLISPTTNDIDMFGFSSSFYDNFYIFNGNNVTSDNYTLRLNIDNGYYVGNPEVTSGVIIAPRLEVRLYKIDAALYHFLKSINDLDGNDLIEYGLAPVLPTTSNVNNGIGILGGCGVEKVEIPILLEDNSFINTIHFHY